MKYVIDSETLTDIADAIRAKTGDNASMTPLEMPDEIASISGGDPLFHEKVGDGNAYLYIYLPTVEHLDVVINVYVPGDASITIDWGDGSSIDTISTQTMREYHTYTAPGYYTIKLTKLSGTPNLGGYAGNNWIFGGSSYPERSQAPKLIGAEFGTWNYSANELIMNSGLCFLYSGESVPNGGANTPYVRENHELYLLEISKNATTIRNYGYANCYNLREVTVPDNITNIAANAFAGVGATFHMEPTTPPAMASTNAFSGNATIYVPYSADHSVLNAYKTATNWSNFANNIFEEPEE